MSCKTKFLFRGSVSPPRFEISISEMRLIVVMHKINHGKLPGGTRTSRLRKKRIKRVLVAYFRSLRHV